MWMLLHGFTGSPRSWDPVVSGASFDEPPVRPFLFGHGPGWHAHEVGSFAEEAQRLCQMAEALRPPRLVAGYSLGARLALGALAEAPELIDGCLLIGVHPGLADEAARAERRALDAERARLLREEGVPAFVDRWEQEPLFETQRALPAQARARQREVRLQHDAEGLARSLETLGLGAMPCYEEVLCAASAPVTLMAGARDLKFRDLATRLAGRNAAFECEIVEGAGHNVVLEAGEAVARAMNGLEHRARQGARA